MEKEKNYVFYDIETNGLDYYNTGIMQISILDIKGNILLNNYAYPYDNRIEGTSIHGIDENKLITNKAVDASSICIIMKKVLREKYGRSIVYFIGYNNFGYDQIILENNFKIVGVKIPENWYFIDLLPIVKEIYPNVKPNYKLKTIYELLCGNNDETINFHCSLSDSICLYRIFNVVIKKSNLHEIYVRPLLQSREIFLSPIFTINGYHKSMQLEKKGINSIGDLYNIFKECDFTIEKIEEILKNKYNIYSNYYLTNIIKSIIFISSFHEFN